MAGRNFFAHSNNSIIPVCPCPLNQVKAEPCAQGLLVGGLLFSMPNAAALVLSEHNGEWRHLLPHSLGRHDAKEEGVLVAHKAAADRAGPRADSSRCKAPDKRHAVIHHRAAHRRSQASLIYLSACRRGEMVVTHTLTSAS
jgi:hypothetical protein